MPSSTQKTWFGSIVEIAGLLLIVFLIRTFGFGLYQVPTGSMETTMLVGERFFADKFSYLFRTPRHGEIIAMNAPEGKFNYSKQWLMNLFQRYVWGPDNWTKRVVGTPGDTVRGVIEDGKPVVYLKKKGDESFTKLDELYLNKYPLITVYNDDPVVLKQRIKDQLISGWALKGIPLSNINIDKLVQDYLLNFTTRKSYDPAKSEADQPFYIIDPTRVYRDEAGNPLLTWPQTPRYARNQERYRQAVEQGTVYWEKDGSDEFNVVLGADEYWVMGDNRMGSEDSRFLGPVKGKNIHGRIIFRIWSLDSNYSWWIVDLLLHPIDFWKRMRWSRFFQFMG